MGKRLEKRNEYYAQLALWGKDQKPTLGQLFSMGQDIDILTNGMNDIHEDGCADLMAGMVIATEHFMDGYNKEKIRQLLDLTPPITGFATMMLMATVCRAGITLASFDKDVDYVLDLMNVCKDDRMKNELQEGLMNITGQEKRRTAKEKPF